MIVIEPSRDVVNAALVLRMNRVCSIVLERNELERIQYNRCDDFEERAPHGYPRVRRSLDGVSSGDATVDARRIPPTWRANPTGRGSADVVWSTTKLQDPAAPATNDKVFTVLM